MIHLVTPVLSVVTFESSSHEDPPLTHLREILMEWACTMRHESCVHYSIRLFEQYLDDPTNSR